jgi:hypothetical protein
MSAHDDLGCPVLRATPEGSVRCRQTAAERSAPARPAEAVAIAGAVGVAAEGAERVAAQATHVGLRRTRPERRAGLEREICMPRLMIAHIEVCFYADA